MPYLQLDVPRRYPVEVKRPLAGRLGNIYADVMQTTPNKVAIAFRELEDREFVALRRRRTDAGRRHNVRYPAWAACRAARAIGRGARCC